MSISSKHLQVEWTQVARISPVGSPSNVDQETAMHSAKDHHIKRHSQSSISSKRKYNWQTESESDDKTLLTHKRHNCHRRAQDSGTEKDSSVDGHDKNKRTREKYLLVIRPANDCFSGALDSPTYFHAYKSSQYNDEVAQNVFKLVNRLQVQRKSHTFDSHHPIYVTSFLSAYKLTCNTNGEYDGAALQLLYFFKFSRAPHRTCAQHQHHTLLKVPQTSEEVSIKNILWSSQLSSQNVWRRII